MSDGMAACNVKNGFGDLCLSARDTYFRRELCCERGTCDMVAIILQRIWRTVNWGSFVVREKFMPQHAQTGQPLHSLKGWRILLTAKKR